MVGHLVLGQNIWTCMHPQLMATYKMVRLTPQAYDVLTSLGRKNESYSDASVSP